MSMPDLEALSCGLPWASSVRGHGRPRAVEERALQVPGGRNHCPKERSLSGCTGTGRSLPCRPEKLMPTPEHAARPWTRATPSVTSAPQQAASEHPALALRSETAIDGVLIDSRAGHNSSCSLPRIPESGAFGTHSAHRRGRTFHSHSLRAEGIPSPSELLCTHANEYSCPPQ